MNARAIEPAPWSRRQWGITILSILVLQFALVFLLSERQAVRLDQAVAKTSFRLAADPTSLRKLAQLPIATDPAVFAAPHPDGFSGAVWRKASSVEHHPGEWAEPQRWLSNRVDTLGAGFNRFMGTLRPEPVAIGSKPRPNPSAPTVAVESVPRVVKSTLRIEGDLAGRGLVTAPVLPVWPHPDVISASVVQVMVDPRGYPMSPTLLSGSGLKEADAKALELANQVRFTALNSSNLAAAAESRGRTVWGKLVFEWCAVAPADPAPRPSS